MQSKKAYKIVGVIILSNVIVNVKTLAVFSKHGVFDSREEKYLAPYHPSYVFSLLQIRMICKSRLSSRVRKDIFYHDSYCLSVIIPENGCRTVQFSSVEFRTNLVSKM